MREFALVGCVALASALASFYFTDYFGWFGYANGVIAAAALAIATVTGARRLRRAAGADSRRVIGRGLAVVLATLALAVAAERLAARSQLQFD